MKITCQSCQSKYNVADEKVQGKIVKIRCRKCGATIVVNGTGGAAAGTNGTTADAGAAGGAQWHVNIGDNDQRTMTMPELVDAYNAGVVTQDTFIWTDGMDDWKPLAEVEPVVSALHASASQMAVGTPGAFETPGLDAAAAAAAAPMAAAHISEAPQSMGGGDPYGGGAGYAAAAAAPVAAEPRRAAVAKREARGRDLFATNVGDEIQTSAPAVPEAMEAAPAAGGLTGQRNENSVLFSLAVLTKNADQRAPQDQTTANKEDSGLIDLKALAAKAESVRPPAGAGGDVFTAPIGGLGVGSSLGAPVGALSPLGTADLPQKSKLPLYIGAGAGMLVLLVLGIVIGVKVAGPSEVPAASVATTVAPPSATVDPSALASASAAPDTSASAAPSASVATKPKYGGAGGGGYHPRPGAGGGGGGGAGAGTGGGGGAAPTPPPAPIKPKGGGDCGCNGDLMCLMKCSTH
jgi:predicted Zn finger-like uncharacterized protein